VSECVKVALKCVRWWCLLCR